MHTPAATKVTRESLDSSSSAATGLVRVPSRIFNALSPEQDRPLSDPQKIVLENPPVDPMRYFEQFERCYPAEMSIFRAVGIHPVDSQKQPFVDPFRQITVEDNFSNIGEHCITVAVTAGIIADALKDAGALSEQDVHRVVRAALLHDSSKVYDVFLNKALNEGRVTRAEYFSEDIWERAKPVLLARGLSPEMAHKILHVHGAMTGGRPDCLRQFITVTADGLLGIMKDNLILKIVHLADDMTCSTPPGCPPTGRHWVLTPIERVSGAFAGKKAPWGWEAGLGLYEAREVVHVEKVLAPDSGVRPLGTYLGLMVWISNCIAREVAVQLHGEIGQAQSAELMIKQLVNTRFASAEAIFATASSHRSEALVAA
jgi:hypothetical protein